MRKLLFTILGNILFYLSSIAQCSIVSDSSGVIENFTSTDSVSYSVSVSGSASFVTFSASTLCGFTFPAITAPWSGNSGAVGTVTYTFSAPVNSLKFFVANAGSMGGITPEIFTFSTNSSIPGLTVDSGTCSPWTVSGNQITSPSILDGVSSIVTVSSVTSFTSLIIESGINSDLSGGSLYGLCNSSADIAVEVQEYSFRNKLIVYPNPTNGIISINLGDAYQTVMVSLTDLSGRLVLSKTYNESQLLNLKIEEPGGVYILTIKTDDKKAIIRLINE